MELNKRKSLLTPASPTVWGMIHGDIDNQQDIVDRISEEVNEVVGDNLTNRIKNEVYTIVNPMLGELDENKQDTLQSGVNIKTMKGRSILGEGDIDPLDEGDRMLLETIETKADKSTTYSKKEVDDIINNKDAANNNTFATKDELQETYIPQIEKYVDDQIVVVEGVVNDAVLELNNALVNYATLEYVNEQIGAIDTMTEDILG